MKFLLILCAVAFAYPPPRFLGQVLKRETSFTSLRIAFHTILGSFSEPHEQELIDRIIPATKSFYSSALKVNRLTEPLKPKASYCGSIQVPQDHQLIGIDADLIIYLYSGTLPIPALGRSCESEGLISKQPIIGYIQLDTSSYFNIFDELQIQYLIRETAHVLAIDQALFFEYIDTNGEKYEDTRYLTLINYPNRGITVKTIGFPKMLQKAREAFDCEIEGLEYEDNFEIQGLENQAFYWDTRVMTHDILSSYMSDQVIFSDITLALFEDSGWYVADYSYSQQIKWGYRAGCEWFEEKCIKQEKVKLDGFCDKNTELNSCDAFGLGYGDCLMQFSDSIPPHERYFSDQKLGGREIFDYCPVVVVPRVQKCRDDRSVPRIEYGESKNVRARCFMNSLQPEDQGNVGRNSEGGCYTVQECTEISVTVQIGDVEMDCPYNSKITVAGYIGYFNCPKDYSFCENLPCKNMCSGQGKCEYGLCKCNDNYSGDDCSISCGKSCKYCTSNKKCLTCADGYLFQSDICVPCSPDCQTCSSLPNICTSCPKGSELQNNQCKKGCLDNCASCDNPCTKCDSGYFLSNGQCQVCSLTCKACEKKPDLCTECFEGFQLKDLKCQKNCDEGCEKCEVPCSKCNFGYFLHGGNCLFCSNLCAGCINDADFCTSCWDGFVLVANSCKQSCKEHCLTCDDPCSQCEDGYFASGGSCVKCDKNCQTCIDKSFVCTTCNDGYRLVGASCEQKCADNCESCEYPCKKCKAGYFLEFEECSKCDANCKTCSMVTTFCDSCHQGYGLIYNSCQENCIDHCHSCAFPCTNCELGYYLLNGVCIKCDISCMACTAYGSDKCTHCAEGYYKENNTCKLSCQEFCLSCDEPCTLCQDGYFNYINGCSACSLNCAKCEGSSDKCTSCSPGSGLINNSCKPGCKDHCQSCNDPCTLCESGYALINNICKPCDPNCLTCSESLTKCTSCKIGYQLNGNVCQASCLPNCATCDYPCTMCHSTYVSVDGICSKCPEGCESCSSSGPDCYSCIDNYVYSDKTCQKTCLPYCKSCDNPCTICEPGYLLVNDICEPCEYPCTSCIDSLSYCTSCPTLYNLESGQCTSKCLSHCASCNNPCTQCDQGFLPFRGICEACSINCKTCDGSPNQCTSCYLGKVLVGQECLNQCIENCVDCSLPCKACNEGYRLGENKCELCEKYIKEENIYAEFIKDFTGIAVNFEFPIMNTTSDCSLYFKSVSLAMLGVGALCTWEDEDRLIVVFGRNPDYYFKSLELFPIKTFGSDCSSSPNSLVFAVTQNTFPYPIISISAPNFFTLGCNSEVLVIEAITEESYFTLEVNTDPKIKEIEDFIATLTGKYLAIPESVLKPVVLNVTFSVTNFLGKKSSVTKNIIVTDKSKISVSVDAGSHIQISNSQTFTFRGVVPQSSCLSHEQLTFMWRYIDSPTSHNIENSEEIIGQSKLNYVLLVKPGDLHVGSHVFRFEAFDHDHHDFSDLQIDVVDSPLVVVLSRSDSSFNVEEKFILSAKNSYDPGSPETVLKYEWECTQESSLCLDTMGEKLLEDTTSDELTIGSYRMIPGTKYIFTIKVSSIDRISSESVIITTNSAPGSILIPTLPFSIDSQSEFSVFPTFNMKKDSYQFKWTQTSGPALKPKSSINNAPYIVFDKNSMMSGQSYNFIINVSNENDTMYSYLHWNTNFGPKCEEIVGTVIGNSVILNIDCYDGDYSDFPLYYVFGIVYEESYVPLRVVHSPSVTFKLNSGNWTLYIEVCDSRQTCVRKEKSVKIAQRMNQEVENLKKYKTEKVLPDNIPLAIFNSMNLFDIENFNEAFEDLKTYIKSQEPALVYLKMAIECLEILTKSNKQHFMKNNQEDIINFLHDIVSQLTYIDDQVMEYIINLFSEHSINHYSQVSKLICAYSERWVKNLLPGEFKQVKNKISLARHRFIGTEYNSSYILNQVKVSNLALEANTNKMYDLLITVFPDSPSPIVDITYYEVGTYDNYNIVFSDVNEVEIELMKPFYIEFKTSHPGDFTCAQLKDRQWVDEGCKVVNTTDSTVKISSWHVSTYRIVATASTKRGYSSLIVIGIQLLFTVIGVAAFCIMDKDKPTYLQANFADYDSPRSSGPREEEKKEDSPERHEESPIKVSEGESLRVTSIIFHPSLNIFTQQSSDRRSASVLYISAVLFAELISIGGMFNPKFNEIFDADNNFTGFSKVQITTCCVGMLLSQFLSGGILCLNQPGDMTITKRYLGMAVCSLFIVFASGLGIVFSLEYPAIYSFYWMIAYSIIIFIEIVIVQSLLWLVSYKIFKKEVEINVSISTRNLRVFTSDN